MSEKDFGPASWLTPGEAGTDTRTTASKHSLSSEHLHGNAKRKQTLTSQKPGPGIVPAPVDQ